MCHQSTQQLIVSGLKAKFLLACGLCLFANLEAVADEQPAPPDPAALVKVHLPLTGNADQVLQKRLLRTRDRLLALASNQKSESRPLLVLELSVRNGEAGAPDSSSFERAFSLARFLSSREMAGVKTVAFANRSVRGHGALLVLACEDVVMAPDALLSNDKGLLDEQGGASQTMIAGYREIAELRRTMPAALAVSLVDPQAQVLQIETEDGVYFVLDEDRAEFIEGREVVDEKTLIPVGTLAEFDGREGRQLGFVKYLASTREALAEAFDISQDALDEDRTELAEWKPVMIDVRGEITAKTVSRIESLLGIAIESGDVNWIGVRIDSAGGEVDASIRLATVLAKIDENAVRTVAYVPTEAAGGAALVALACDNLVIHPEARLQATTQELELEDQAAIVDSLSSALAPLTDHSWSLLAAMVDPSIALQEFQQKNTGVKRIMSPEEAAALPDSLDWQQPQPILADDGPLKLSGERALELDLAWKNVDSFDQLKELFALAEDPVVLQPNWALELVEAMASPQLSFLLLLIGFAGLFLELRTPGLGIGGFIATVALVLFFWSKFLDGTAGWLEVLLFVTGLVFILLEIFVLPGFGIFGLGGGALVVASLVLASLTFVAPHSESDMRELVGALGSVIFACAGVFAFIILSNYFLPQVPWFNKMVLQSPSPEERAFLEKNESLVDYSDLVGISGVATTHLRPAGKAEIDNQLLDVISESEPLDAGTAVVVVETRGNRVIVRAAKSGQA